MMHGPIPQRRTRHMGTRPIADQVYNRLIAGQMTLGGQGKGFETRLRIQPRKDMGRHHAPRFHGRAELLATSAIGLTIGFYDGFFGPGTGSFFVFLLVRWLGYDFLNASVAAKLLNLSSNIAALVLFTYKGHVWWHMALPLAMANVAGSLLGTRMALQHGAGFVRGMFIVVVSALICKTSFDAFLR
jgi:uncharacterized membrane protein YfcA